MAVLAWIRDEVVIQTFREWLAAPPPWYTSTYPIETLMLWSGWEMRGHAEFCVKIPYPFSCAVVRASRMTYSWRNARLILSPPQIEMCLPGDIHRMYDLNNI